MSVADGSVTPLVDDLNWDVEGVELSDDIPNYAAPSGKFLWRLLTAWAAMGFRAPAVEASLIAYLWPLLLVVFSALLPGERLRWWHLAGGVAGLVGAGLLVTRGGGENPEGGQQGGAQAHGSLQTQARFVAWLYRTRL